jgi:hypothetical protein
MRRDTNYLGGRLTFRGGQVHISGAVLRDVSTSEKGTVVSVSAGLSIVEF